MSTEKLEAQKQWNENPCGTGPFLDDLADQSLEYFEEVRRNRYEVSDPWMRRIIPFDAARGKRLLEIGHGMGTDLLTFAEAGAEVYGIDITAEHHELASENFRLHGRSCILKLCDAAEIDFPSAFFDIVYSHGVLHHTPDTVRCISEAYRVLKPGGILILSMYRTWSAFHIFSQLLYRGVLRGELRRLGYRGLMSTVERGADGVSIKPLVKTYTKAELRHILSDFRQVDFKVGHFAREHIPGFWRLIPRQAETVLEPFLGWYLVAIAAK